MKRVVLLVSAAVLVRAVAWAQLTTFNSSGGLSWTNSIARGFYKVESSESPSGPWNALATVADLDWAKTNHISLQAPVTNAQVFFRVAWIPPNPIGVWDYRGYDAQGTLVITGQLSIGSTTVLSTNPANSIHGIQGSWNFQYTGPPTNQLWYFGPQIGTGYLGGTLDVGYARLRLVWPSDTPDDSIQLFGTLWPNTYTGSWTHATWVGHFVGPFSAVRIPSTNLSTSSP